MKIIYSYITAPTGGSRVHIDSFVAASRNLGQTVLENGFVSRPYAGGKHRWTRATRFKVKLGWVFDNLHHFFTTLRLAKQTRPDVLLFRFDPMHHFILAIVGLSLVYPVVLEINAVRSIEYARLRPWISDWFDWLALLATRRHFVVSERLKAHICGRYRIGSKRIAVIENGVDTDLFRPDGPCSELRKKLGIEGRFVVGFVGSFRPWHGVDHLIDVAAALVPELPEALFLLVGDGPDRSMYTRRIAERGLSPYFVFTGHVPHAAVPGLIRTMDVLLAPVARAGFAGGFHGSALKVFEYMAMAKPVIAAPMGQLREVVEQGVSGFLVESDRTADMVEAIQALYRDPILRRRIGFNARRRVMAQYTWRINAARVRSLCEEACHA